MTSDKQTDTLALLGIGQRLREAREELNHSVEHIAAKLHLRSQVIELLEADCFERLPQAVFVKGYIRAYAKCVGVDCVDLIETYNMHYNTSQNEFESNLWQRRRDDHGGANLVKWFTVLSLSAVLLFVGLWWKSAAVQPNQDNGITSGTAYKQIDKQKQVTSLNKMSAVIKLPSKEVAHG